MSVAHGQRGSAHGSASFDRGDRHRDDQCGRVLSPARGQHLVLLGPAPPVRQRGRSRFVAEVQSGASGGEQDTPRDRGPDRGQTQRADRCRPGRRRRVDQVASPGHCGPAFGDHDLADPDRPGLHHPRPAKAPKTAGRSFQAERANDCWQIDDTIWALADDTEVKILNVLDDHSRLLVASTAHGLLHRRGRPRRQSLTAAAPAGLASTVPVRQRPSLPSRARRCPRSARNRRRALPALSPPDQRQSRTVPPDPQDTGSPANPPAANLDRAPDPARHLPVHLQPPAPPPQPSAAASPPRSGPPPPSPGPPIGPSAAPPAVHTSPRPQRLPSASAAATSISVGAAHNGTNTPSPSSPAPPATSSSTADLIRALTLDPDPRPDQPLHPRRGRPPQLP